MIAVGVDIIENRRIEDAINQWKNLFLDRIYTVSELHACANIITSLAGRFAAKEATMKILGVNNMRLFWKDIEIMASDSGAPVINLYGRARKAAEEMGIMNLSISVSHTNEYAVAFVVGYDR